ncbi:peptidase S58 DmpA [Methylocella silvestris BL2]|uniref:Peptidase S58 DmpA n=1 Tax=Methylocella silvestris (strain DSM 15510 / CIP 108128 / LMG 27833 / NCIMB 13906 / BL2) TaxID=395965 RepID=B8ENC9_METSB|nr:P1 family peptidase [Methylocella silvestris]ACK50060.1 peptidase S58 DmpA [Methylocella silvestris BL2]
MKNLITDVAGLRVGNAQDPRIASGVTTVLFEAPAVASIAIHGGAPGGRDTALLEPGMTVESVNALVLSGGSVYGLDSMGGVTAFLRAQGQGFSVGAIKVPIAPGAVLFDLLNGGDKDFGGEPIYWRLGFEAAAVAGLDFSLGTAGAGYGATTADLKGGLGSASAQSASGFTVGALVAVNAVGRATIGEGPHFWAAPYEREAEFGRLGWPALWPSPDFKIKSVEPQNTTIAIVATDAALTRSEAKRLAVMAQDGMARALRPAHAAMDGDTVFSAATGLASKPATLTDKIEIGALAADCLARAIARAVYEARALPFAASPPDWRKRFGKS